MKQIANIRFYTVIAVTALLLGSCKGTAVATPTPLDSPAGADVPKEQEIGTAKVVATVNSDRIFVRDLQLRFDRQDALRVRMGGREISDPAELLQVRQLLLDDMIIERLILQDAEKNGVRVSDAELDEQIRAVRASAGVELSNQEFENRINQQYGMDIAAFKTQVRNQLIEQRYMMEQYLPRNAVRNGIPVSDADIDAILEDMVQQYRMQEQQVTGRLPDRDEAITSITRQTGADLDTLKGRLRDQYINQQYFLSLGGGDPTEEEIATRYRVNREYYKRAETISFDYIQFPRTNREAAVSLAREIGTSTSAFNDKFDLGRRSNSPFNIGNLANMPLEYPNAQDTARFLQAWGLEFMTKAAALSEKNNLSGLIETPQGFFIIKLTRKYDKKILELDDDIQVGLPITLRQSINEEILQEHLNIGLEKVLQDIAAELKAKGTVKITEENLNW
ncbi:hypothetical protein AGMMS49546_27900 [Spirochaetia bacterium]|nr:hypothetical protein AGMMS49546_27900 [Spirochaetia bacterium]